MPGDAKGPLAGFRVIDVTTVLLGPYAAQWLGDLGADVIKVEAPPTGDVTRAIGPARHAGMSGTFLNVNRNKRSIALDLKQESARAALRTLIGTADVFLHNMRAQAIGRLGFAYDDVARLKPDIVYCGAFGYSQKGPYASRPAYDDLVQAHAGLAAMAARIDGVPRFAPTVMADKMIGIVTAMSVMAALIHRQKTGEGQQVEVPMFETLTSYMAVEHLSGAGFEPPLSKTGYARLTTPYRRPYRSKDGYIALIPYTDKHWRGIFEIAGRADMAADSRFSTYGGRTANIHELYQFLDEIAATRTNAEWMEACLAKEIPCAPVTDLDELLNDEHIRAVGLFERHEHPTEGATVLTGTPVTFSRSPASIRSPAPRFGEHGAELLRAAGVSDSDIAALRASGALLEPDSQG